MAVPEQSGIRVARPVRAAHGGWIAAGWEAWLELPGEPDPARCDDVVRAGKAFHALLADLPRPSFLDDRDEPWSFGDQVPWEEVPLRALIYRIGTNEGCRRYGMRAPERPADYTAVCATVLDRLPVSRGRTRPGSTSRPGPR